MNRIAGYYGSINNFKEDAIKMISSMNYKRSNVEVFYNDKDIALYGLIFSSWDRLYSKFIVSEDEKVVIGIDGVIYDVKGFQKDEASKTIDDLSIMNLYKEQGEGLFSRLNGQFSMVILDRSKDKLMLIRDRFGQKPMFYSKIDENIFFSSEINSLKSIIEDNKIDSRCLRDVSSTWSSLGDHTLYENIKNVEPGSYLVFSNGSLESVRYFNISILQDKDEKKEEELIEELDALLNDSIRKRLEDDKKDGFYLSGGLDSSLICAIASKHSKDRLNTFSICFENEDYDEEKYQNMISDFINSHHKSLMISDDDIISNIDEVVKLIRTPILRTSLVPMFLLSKFVKEDGFDAVLSGEGADELFGGYDIFKEVKIREFCERDPLSVRRSMLYKRLYSYVNGYENLNAAGLSSFFNKVKLKELFSSHITRFKFGDFCFQFFDEDVKKKIEDYDYKMEIKEDLPSSYEDFSNIAKAQYLEIKTFLNNYLLLIQGDCISMANGVVGKFPFLDNKIADFAFSLKDKFKINVLNEKYLLKKLASRYLPKEFLDRKKFPFRAPINCSKILQNEQLISCLLEENLNRGKIFNAKAVSKFLNALRAKNVFSEREQSLLIFILSIQLLLKDEIILT